MRIYLTGGTGLVGSHVADLLRARGAEVVALQRPASDTRFLEEIGCEIVTGGLQTGADSLAASMKGCTGVVHSAALIYSDLPWTGIRSVNVEGTGRILRAAVRAGVPRMVHLSSIAVYGNPPGRIDEEHPLDFPLRPEDSYARSKREAEEVALRAHGRGEIEVTVLRPSPVYGERDRLFAPKLGKLVRRPLVPILGPGTNILPVVYAGNLAVAVELALENDGGAGLAFNIAEDRPTTQLELLEGIARGMGRTPRFLHLPGPVVRWGARVGDSLGIRIPKARDLSLSRVARIGLEDNPYSSARIRDVLGWRPPHDVRDALERTGAWLGAS